MVAIEPVRQEATLVDRPFAGPLARMIAYHHPDLDRRLPSDGLDSHRVVHPSQLQLDFPPDALTQVVVVPGGMSHMQA